MLWHWAAKFGSLYIGIIILWNISWWKLQIKLGKLVSTVSTLSKGATHVKKKLFPLISSETCQTCVFSLSLNVKVNLHNHYPEFQAPLATIIGIDISRNLRKLFSYLQHIIIGCRPVHKKLWCTVSKCNEIFLTLKDRILKMWHVLR